MKTLKEAKQKSEIELAVDAYLAEIGVSYSVVPRGTGLKRDGWECDGWFISLTADGKPNEPQDFDYFTGIGHRVDHGNGPRDHSGPFRKNTLAWESYQKNYVKPFAPFAAGPIHSLILDSSADDQSFNDWCSNYGYDNDSRKAFETYQACCASAAKLRKVFTREQIEKLSELLQDY